MAEKNLEYWELWYPKAGAAGLFFSRGAIAPAETILVHSAPEVLTVIVRGADGTLKAQGQDLTAGENTPISRLRCKAGKVEREDIWPNEEDLGTVVLLSGGEAGVLKSWWNAPDHSEWRWQIELYNHK